MQVRHNITLDEDISHELDTIAGELGEKKSYIIEKALAEVQKVVMTLPQGICA